MTVLAARKTTARRRGMTLVELMAGMAAVAAMLGICTALLGLAMRLESDGRAAFESSRELDRLAARLRLDVHAARSATIESRTLRLGGDGGSLEYRLDDPAEVARVALDGDRVVARDPYRIPQPAGVTAEVREVDGRPFVVLAVALRGRADRIDPSRVVEIAAAVGRGRPPAVGEEGGRP